MSDARNREVVAVHDSGPFRFVEANHGYFHVLRTPEGMTLIDPEHFEDFKKLMRSVLGVEPKVWYGQEDLDKEFTTYTLGAPYASGDTWRRNVLIQGKFVGFLRPAKSETRVLSALEADEGEG